MKFLSHNHEPRNNRILTKPVKQARSNESYETEKELSGSKYAIDSLLRRYRRNIIDPESLA